MCVNVVVGIFFFFCIVINVVLCREMSCWCCLIDGWCVCIGSV